MSTNVHLEGPGHRDSGDSAPLCMYHSLLPLMHALICTSPILLHTCTWAYACTEKPRMCWAQKEMQLFLTHKYMILCACMEGQLWGGDVLLGRVAPSLSYHPSFISKGGFLACWPSIFWQVLSISLRSIDSQIVCGKSP